MKLEINKLGITARGYVLSRSDWNLVSMLTVRELSTLSAGGNIADTLLKELKGKITDVIYDNENEKVIQSKYKNLISLYGDVSKKISSIILDDVSFIEKLERTIELLDDSSWVSSYAICVAAKARDKDAVNVNVDETVHETTKALTRLFTHLYVIDLEFFMVIKERLDSIIEQSALSQSEITDILDKEKSEYDVAREAGEDDLRLVCYKYLMK